MTQRTIYVETTLRKLTQRAYAAAIPACCEYQTLEEHQSHLMLCWGLVRAVEKGCAMDCTGCELAIRRVTFWRPLPQEGSP